MLIKQKRNPSILNRTGCQTNLVQVKCWGAAQTIKRHLIAFKATQILIHLRCPFFWLVLGVHKLFQHSSTYNHSLHKIAVQTLSDESIPVFFYALTYQKSNRPRQICVYSFNHELPLCLQLVWWFSAFVISFFFQFCAFMLNIDLNLFLRQNSIVMVKRPLQEENMTTTNKYPTANIFRYAIK